MNVLTGKKKATHGQPPLLAWGQAKGCIKHIELRGFNALYVIEEVPGYRTIRFNRKKYKIFCPWMYFLVHVEFLEGEFFARGGYLRVFSSKSRIESVNEKAHLRMIRFPNTSIEGAVCMPDDALAGSSPLLVAIEAVSVFWESRGTEIHADPEKMPEVLDGKWKKNRRTTLFSVWSKLDPRTAMALDWPLSGKASTLMEAVQNYDWDW